MITGFAPYPVMKDSGVEWLGKVPAHWEVRRLSDSVWDCVNGVWGVDPNGVDDLPCVRVADFNRQSLRVREPIPTIRAVSSSERRRRMLEPGDLLLEKSGGGDQQPVGIVILFDRQAHAVCSNFVARMPVRDGFDSAFLTFLHSSLYAIGLNKRSIKQTTGIQNLDSSSYLNEAVAFPPLLEQVAIVRVLDYVDRRVRRLVRAKRKLIALLTEQKQAIIHRAVTRGLDPDIPLKDSGIEWLGKIPAHWEVRKLRFDFRYVKGGRAAEITSEYIGANPGPFPVFSGQTENNGLMGKIGWHEFDLGTDAILVTTVGARAMSTRLLSGAFSLSQNCAIIVPRDSRTSASYYEMAMRRLFAYEKASISLIMQPSLRFSDLNRFYVPVPLFSEQVAIVEHLNQATASIDATIARAKREIDLLNEYRTCLIADVVTGKLDVRATAMNLPDDSPKPMDNNGYLMEEDVNQIRAEQTMESEG